MSMHPRPFIPVAAFLASFGAAWWTVSAMTSRPAIAANGPVVAPRPETPGTGTPEREKIDSAMAPIRAAKDRWAAMQAAILLARNLTPAEQKAWLDGAWFKFSDPLVSKVFTEELEALLFDSDPAGFVTALLDRKQDSANRYLNLLATTDPESVIALGQASEDTVRKQTLIMAGAKALVDRDPARAFKLILDFPPPEGISPDMVRVLGKASSGDIAKLLKIADERGDRWRPVLRAAAMQVMAEKDFASAMTWLNDAEDGPELFAAIFAPNSVTLHEAKELARRIAENLDSIPDGFGGKVHEIAPIGWPVPYMVGDYEEVWLQADLDRLGLNADQQKEVMKIALRSLGFKSPAAAAKWLMADSLTPKDRLELVRWWMPAFTMMGKPAPPELLAVMDEPLLNEVKRIETQAAANASSPRQIPTVESGFLQAMTDKDSNALMLPSRRWGQAQVEEAISYVQSRDHAVIQDMVTRLHYTGDVLYPVHAEIYRQALLKNITTAHLTPDLIEMSIKWGAVQPAKAAAWAESLPPGKERQFALRNIASQWNSVAPKEAESWITSLKDPAEIEAAMEAVANSKPKRE